MTNRIDKSLDNQVFLFNSHHTVKNTTEFVRNIFDFLLLDDEILLDLVDPDVEPPDVHLRVLRPRVVGLQLRLQLPDLFLQFVLPLERSFLGHLDSGHLDTHADVFTAASPLARIKYTSNSY